MDRSALAATLEEAFEADGDTATVVARAADDLAESGRYREDVGAELDTSVVLDELMDAPEGSGLEERWNWWIGSLDLAFGGYDRFRVREQAL